MAHVERIFTVCVVSERNFGHGTPRGPCATEHAWSRLNLNPKDDLQALKRRGWAFYWGVQATVN